MTKRNPWRPTKYKPEYAGQLIDFFFAEDDAWREKEDSGGRVQLIPNRLPTFERFASEIGVCVRTLQNWAGTEDGEPVHPDFFRAYARARDRQHALLIEGGLAGVLSPAFTGLAMKNLYGWKDRIEAEVDMTMSLDLTEVDERIRAAKVKQAENAAVAAQRMAEYET